MKRTVVIFSMLGVVLAACVSVARADGDNSFRFIVLSDVHVGANDSGSLEKYTQTVNEIKAMTGANKPAAVFITGDITDSGYESGAYDPNGSGSTYSGQITHFKNWIRDPLVNAGIPVYMILGNHDGNHQSTASEFAAAMGIPLYQSIDIQKTHFILTNGVPDNVQGAYGAKGGASWGIGQAGQIDTTQLNWIESDLQSDNNTQAKLSIMMNHFPLWGDMGGYAISNTDYWGNTTNAGTKLKQWVAQYGVDAYLYGHRHNDSTGKGFALHDNTGALIGSVDYRIQDMDTLFDPADNGHAYTYDTGVTADILIEKNVGGAVYTYTNPQGSNKTATYGYDVFDVNDYTLNHYRKVLDTYYGQQVGPQQEWSLTVPEPATMGLLALGGLAMLIRRSRRV